MALSSVACFLLLLLPLLSHAVIFNIFNNCTYTIWAAAVPGGGKQLDPGKFWTVNIPSNTTGSIWPRTNCTFNPSGNGNCSTGDCDGLLQCTGSGFPPNTLAEYALGQTQNLDFYDISLVDGFNVPMDFAPTSACQNIDCAADIVAQCPAALRVKDGCNNPCTTFGSANYCCTGSAATNCGPTNYSRFFKNLCPDAYSYPKDDATSTFTCPTGTNYRVTFCPPNNYTSHVVPQLAPEPAPQLAPQPTMPKAGEDENKRSQLDWTRRHLIIVGIARGLLYLHEDSLLKVIHRDLKASNVLLDNAMNPKISDFGMAKIFETDVADVNTGRVVGTFGYMAPEFAMDGIFSEKSDVYSFGVLLLEIVSGQKNGRSHFEQHGQIPSETCMATVECR